MEKTEEKGLRIDINANERLNIRFIGDGLLIGTENNCPSKILNQIAKMVDMGFHKKTGVGMSVRKFVEMINSQCRYEDSLWDDSIVMVIPERLIPVESLLTLCGLSVGEGLNVGDFRDALHDTTKVVDFIPGNPYLIRTITLKISEDLAGKVLNQEIYGKLSLLLREKKLRWLSIEEGLAVKREGSIESILLNAFYERYRRPMIMNTTLSRQRGLSTIISRSIINIGVIQGYTLDFVAVDSDNGFVIPENILVTDYYM